MSTVPENSSSDVESQRSLLGEGGQTRNANKARLKQALMRVILLIQSTEHFKLKANYAPDRISSSSSSASATSYASIPGSSDDHQILIDITQRSKMSTVLENTSSDIESQRSLLGEGGQTGNANKARLKQALMRVILLIRSTKLFKLAANYAPDRISCSSSSASATDCTSIPSSSDTHQILLRCLTYSTHREDLPITAHPEYNIGEPQNFQPKIIAEIVKKRNFQDLHNFGGVQRVAEALKTDLKRGIDSPQRISPFERTQLSRVLLNFFYSILGACNDYTIFFLFCAAVLSLGFGIKEEGLKMGWLNGAILVFTIVVLVTCTAIRKFWKKWSSNKKLEDYWQSNGRKIQVQVIRAGKPHLVREVDLKVGDIVALQKGDQVPGDGLFTNGEALELDSGSISVTIHEKNPFLFYGSRVINGNARMVMTSTCMDTTWGEIMSQVSGSANDKCKFESCLHRLNTCVHISGLLISILIIIVLFIRYKAGKLDDERRYRPESKGEPTRMTTIMHAIEGIITGSRGTARVLTLLSLSLLGIMEGMTFVITLATITWSCKILKYKASVRDYQACVKMASVTTICSDKFGGLTEDEREVHMFFVGEELVSESSVIASDVLEGFCDGIGTSLFDRSDRQSKVTPLISWAKTKLGMKEESFVDHSGQSKVKRSTGGDPFKERCKVLMEKNGNNGQNLYLHYKGPPPDILSLCSHYYNISGKIQKLDDGKRKIVEQIIKDMRSEDSEVIAYARKIADESDVAEFDVIDSKSNGLIFMGMIGLKHTKRENARKAVSTLRDGGITTILASGDDVDVLKTIGENCGLLSSDDLVLTGERFRGWTDEQRIHNVEKIRILGNCLPDDKILLIKSLRGKGKVVALLGQTTADAPALKLADIGLTVGTWSSKVAIESSDINIWNGDFSFLVNLIENGRCLQKNIQKFIQLELIFIISSSLINFTTTVLQGDAPITAVQLFWLNLVVPLFGGLALLIGPSTKELQTIEPFKSSTKLINMAMWRNIAIQAFYQTAIFVSLHQKAPTILGTTDDRAKSVTYNGFFLCQVANKFIAREPGKRNIFHGLFRKNGWFWMALVLLIICQAVFATVEKVVGNSPGLNWKLWAVCLLIAVVSWLLDWVGKTASNLTVLWAEDDSGKLKWSTLTRPIFAR